MLNAWLKAQCMAFSSLFFLLQLKVMLLNQKAGHPRQIPAATPIPPPSLSGSRSLHGSRRRKMKQRKETSTGCAKRSASWPRMACGLSPFERAFPASTQAGMRSTSWSFWEVRTNCQ